MVSDFMPHVLCVNISGFSLCNGIQHFIMETHILFCNLLFFVKILALGGNVFIHSSFHWPLNASSLKISCPNVKSFLIKSFGGLFEKEYEIWAFLGQLGSLEVINLLYILFLFLKVVFTTEYLMAK